METNNISVKIEGQQNIGILTKEMIKAANMHPGKLKMHMEYDGVIKAHRMGLIVLSFDWEEITGTGNYNLMAMLGKITIDKKH